MLTRTITITRQPALVFFTSHSDRMEGRRKSSAGLTTKTGDKNGEEFAILSSRFKDKKERAKANKRKGKKDDQLKVEKQKKKEELEEVNM